MRPSQYAQSPTSERPWAALATLLPHLWEFRGRVLIALGFLILAKLASIGIPLIIKEIVDALDKPNALPTLPIDRKSVV